MGDVPDDICMATWTMCVTDLEKSLRFYRDGLGFIEGQSHGLDIPAGTEQAKAMGLPDGARTDGTFISRPDVRIRLVTFRNPSPIGDRAPRPTHQIGPRCMIFLTKNPKALADRLVTLGGTVTQQRLGPPFDAVFVADPDGFSLQLENLPYAQFEGGFAPVERT